MGIFSSSSARPVTTKTSFEICQASNNFSTFSANNESFCPLIFDRIGCWPPTPPGVRQTIPCPVNVFPTADPAAFATRLCTNESKWENKSNYALCIGCSSVNRANSSFNTEFSLPNGYILARRYFVVCANGISVVLLAFGILILLGNSRLRKCSRNILHVNVFLVFLIRSIIQIFTELRMTRGYFAHNVFERVDACNSTTTYFKEDTLLDCQLFTILMNYINGSVSHWFVFCEALYLFRLLRAKAYKDQIRWYILTGWLAPLVLTVITYTVRYESKTNLQTCWFEPSTYDWILHGPNIILQLFNVTIFIYICILLARKLNKTYRTAAFADRKRFAKYSRLTRSTLILLPIFGIHYFFFMWNMKPLLISNLILIHLTVQTLFSSLQGLIVALIYTLINSEVQGEIVRSFDRCLTKHNSRFQHSTIIRSYITKLDNDRLYSFGYPARSTPPVQYRAVFQSAGQIQHYRSNNQQNLNSSNVARQDSMKTASSLARELALLNGKIDRRT